MGHSCAFFLILSFSSSDMYKGVCVSLPAPELSSIGSSVVRRRLLRLPSSITSISESAYLTRGAGQGTMCGIPTTKKETRRVVPKSEVVRRDRGWRWGVMADGAERRSSTRLGAHAVAIVSSHWILATGSKYRVEDIIANILSMIQPLQRCE